MDIKEKILIWLSEERQKYIDSGKELFLNTPDEWYEPYHVVCENGHVSTRTLKSEALGRNACLACMGEVYLCPPINEIDLSLILN